MNGSEMLDYETISNDDLIEEGVGVTWFGMGRSVRKRTKLGDHGARAQT